MTARRGPRIFYLTPDFDHPSWGVGLLYGHVRLLRARGWRAAVLHHHRPFGVSWLEAESAPCHLDDPHLDLSPEDVVVMPEILATDASALPAAIGRRVLFVQGTLPLVSALDSRSTVAGLGFERALTTMPHLEHVLGRFYGLEATIVPPFVAHYFFSPSATFERNRAKRVLLHMKPDYERAGFPDGRVVEGLWHDHGPPGWELDRFAGLDHRQLAARMSDSVFLVNLNMLESFNATVPEAMAAGCVCLCYEAVGGRDFLQDEDNAFVYANNDFFSLVERLLTLTTDYNAHRSDLRAMRRRARATAEGYREERTADALDAFFHGWLG